MTPLKVTLQVLDVFESLGIEYLLVGSLATSAVGVPRSTIDADVVADLRPEHARELAPALSPDFYVSHEAMDEAIERRSMFNLIHLQTSFKVDVYVLGSRPFDRTEFSRRTPRPVSRESRREVPMATPEDLVISKLEWFELGNRVSERQWRDLLGVLTVQRERLDWGYLVHWCGQLGLVELLEAARAQAGP